MFEWGKGKFFFACLRFCCSLFAYCRTPFVFCLLLFCYLLFAFCLFAFCLCAVCLRCAPLFAFLLCLALHLGAPLFAFLLFANLLFRRDITSAYAQRDVAPLLFACVAAKTGPKLFFAFLPFAF